MEAVHVIPMNDLKEHVQRENCHCHPEVQKDLEIKVIIHRAFDCRTLLEIGKERWS